MPLRVSRVPKIDMIKVRMINTIFQTFSMPFFSWTMTECRNAVPISQGIIEAFSTGSHAQKPPQPSSWYAHLPPSMIPILRNIHATIVQRRVVRIHVSPSCLVIMAAMANAKGTAKPTKPRYSIGG